MVLYSGFEVSQGLTDVLVYIINNLNKSKVFSPEKFPAVLKLPYIRGTSRVFEVKVKDLTKKSYNQISPRILFLSKPLIKMQLKDPI